MELQNIVPGLALVQDLGVDKTSSIPARSSTLSDLERRPKILLTNFHLGTGGGHRTYLLSLLQSSLTAQFDLALACPPSSSINALARRNGGRVFDQLFPGKLRDIAGIAASVRGLERIHREFPFEIIHCNGSRDHWIALYWKMFYRRTIRIVRSRHAIKKLETDVVHRWMFERATALNIFVSQGMLPLSLPTTSRPWKNFIVISNGIDTEEFRPRPRDLDFAATLGILPSHLVIGSHAGLGPHKRVDVMLEAVAKSPLRGQIKIVLLGESRSAGQYVNIARHQFGMNDTVIYGGMLDDVRPCLSLFDLGFVLSDSIETSSYAAKEMLAMAIPLVCSRFSGLPENVDEGENGFLIAPGDADALSHQLTQFFQLSPDRRKAWGDHSRTKAVREFSRQWQLDAMARAYHAVGTGMVPASK